LLKYSVCDSNKRPSDTIKELGNLYDSNKKFTIYTDAENVHNEKIQSETIELLKQLILEDKKSPVNFDTVREEVYTVSSLRNKKY
jgi:hypothetical protein